VGKELHKIQLEWIAFNFLGHIAMLDILDQSFFGIKYLRVLSVVPAYVLTGDIHGLGKTSGDK